jgi:nitrite reductase/ring-hydroxylating ferredoxin subunit
MHDPPVRVATLNEIPERRCKLVSIDGEEIVLWKVEGKIYAMNNVCPHQHFSKLHEGTLEGLYLTCPMHGWTFNLENGKAKDGNGRARVYEVSVQGRDIFIGSLMKNDE